MFKRMVGCVLLANIILVTLIPTVLPASSPDEPPWWDNNWSFRKEVVIPKDIDTGDEQTHFQPVDIFIEFDPPCWAKNEEEYSLRIIFQDEENFLQLESQIYDLIFLDEEHIKTCSVVFLIPKEANGKERYYIYYDDDKKSAPNYPNHVDVGEFYYRYEQMGLTFESSYYKVIEGDYIVFAINKLGKAFDVTTSQQVGKLKKGTKDVTPSNGELSAGFNFIYFWKKDGSWHSTSSSQRLTKNKIFLDGNLMVKIGIESESNDGFLRSTVIYKYYYCPTDNKRVYTHVKHEIITYPLPLGEEIDVSFAIINFGSIKSNNIAELNFGIIPPYLHFNNDEERIFSYDIDQYPEEKIFRGYIVKKDDYDLGRSAWASIDYGESGKAYAIIFESNKVLKNGTDERDGIELQLYEKNLAQLPGLTAYLAYLYMMRNAYEKEDVESDEELPENYVVEFNAEIFTTENGGYPTVEKEAKLYQSLIKFQPTHDENIIDDTEETEKFNLTAYVHNALSFPFGSLLSTIVKGSFPYLTAEIYLENNFTSSGPVCRLSTLENLPSDFLKMSLIEKIKMIPTMFDWKNLSFFKKIRFQNLEKGQYIIKIFRDNLLFDRERQFIGFAIVDLEKDTDTNIYCKPEGRVKISVLSQDGTGLENFQMYLLKDNIIISKEYSDSNGTAIIKAPCNSKENYILDIKYKGFLIKEEQIRLGSIRKYIPLKKTFDFDVYDFEVSIKDSDSNIPTFDILFSLTSDEMQDPISLNADNVVNGVYKFNDLYPANYSLILNYKSFEIREKIKIPGIESIEINLYDLIANIKDSWNLSPGATFDVTLTSLDFEKNVTISGELLSTKEYLFSNLYPGNYTLKVRFKSYSMEEFINIPNTENIILEFPVVFNITALIFDSQGNPLTGARVLMERGEEGNKKEVQGNSDEKGMVIFSLPPGNYVCKIFSGTELIAKRNLEVLNEKTFTAVTTFKPLLPSIIAGITIISLIGVAIVSYRKRNPIFFLKVFAILIVFVAIVSPWWAVYGSSSKPYMETSTEMFIEPTELVTITSNENVTSGELADLKGRFKNEFDLFSTTVVIEFKAVIELLPMVLVLGLICIIISLMLNRYSKNRLSFIIFLLAVIIFVICFVGFFYAMSEVAKQTVGSFIGGGNLEVNIPGENSYETISCNWGPSIGFYLLFSSIIILIFAFYLDIRKTVFKKLKRIKQ